MDTCKLEILDIHCNSRYVKDYLERFEIWCLNRKSLDAERKTAHFLTAVGKEAYALIKTLAFPESPTQLKCNELKELLLKDFQSVNFEAAERAKSHCLACDPNQSVRDFILQLQTQSVRCNFKDQLQPSSVLNSLLDLTVLNYSSSYCWFQTAHFKPQIWSANNIISTTYSIIV
ncbi:unnamed protein product [Echinostoma caproni]|uniref:Retrotrans_gag domain-containing protein n=1 Tax=Echinostoma caproni TaxID=27848 RepID=A0A183AMW5_9TREM|nr:unnamed protein product [Echinostoma caproni]